MFSTKSSATCYSGSCGLCSSCVGEGNKYIFPEIVIGPAEQEEALRWMHRNKVRKQFKELKDIDIPSLLEEEQRREERLKEEKLRQEERKKQVNTMRIADEYEEFESGDYQKRMKELVEGTISDYQSGEVVPATYLSFGRAIGVDMEGTYEVEAGYLYDADKFNRVDNLSNEKFQEYTEKFSLYKEKMSELITKYDWNFQNDPGKIPLTVDHEGKQYTLIQDTICALCDDPECTMIAHCCLEQDTYGIISDYYSGVPIYTHNKKHELCALCILK